MLMVPFLLAAILFSYFGLQRVPAAGRQRQMSDKAEAAGMEYLQSLPRRWATLYVPIGVFLFVLLFRSTGW